LLSTDLLSTIISTLSLHDALPISKCLTQERSSQGFVFTISLGIAGAIIGGFLGQSIGFYQSATSFFMAAIGSITLLVIYSFLIRSEEHTSELQSLRHLVCRLLLEK